MNFEQTGWSRIDIAPAALDPVEVRVRQLGIDVEDFDIAPIAGRFREYIGADEYAGGYRSYGGSQWHCFLEKALEHFVSFELANPRTGDVGIDVGSCQSVAPAIARRLFGATIYEQDLVYPAGVSGNQIGSSADAIPLPDSSVDFMMLHCTFEHFEGNADTGFIRECARMLKPGGRVVILPLYLNANYCNVTGETDPTARENIGFDEEARFHSVIPEWRNRFGRHYSPGALQERVVGPARDAGLAVRLLRARSWEIVDTSLWLRWILVLTKPVLRSSDGVLPAKDPNGRS